MNLLLQKKLAAGLSLFVAAGFFASAYAQAVDAAKPAGEVQTLEKFTVTGSYLPVSASVTASPVVTLQSSAIGQSGATDPLRLLRQLTPFFSGNGNIGTELNNGGSGESNVALRNLTTLVLINGQRIISSPSSNGTSVDLNIIPTAMIDHIDILKDGASTIYGSDAIGGVVNVILKQNYNGFEIGTRFGGATKGDYKTREAYVMGGVSQPGFHLTVSAQHYENNNLLTTDRPSTTLTPTQIKALGFNTTSAVFSGSYPGRVGSDILAGSPLAVGAPGYNAKIISPGIKSSPSAAPQTLAELRAAGIYIPASTTPAFIAAGSATMLNTTLFGNPLILNTKRNQFVASGEKDLVGKNLQVFGDFLYSQTTNGGSGLAPSPIAGVGAGGGNSLSIPANNPYNLFGVVLGVGQAAGAPAARNRLVEIGKRTSINETNVWRVVLGLKGEITDKYSWSATYNYSRGSLLSRILGGANGANMNQLMTPLLRNGEYVYNAAGRPLSVFTDASGNNLPVYNYFALPGFNDPATLEAIRTTLYQSGDTSLRNLGFVVNGKPFELPAGDVGFALGVQTGTEELTTSVDALFANGLALGYNPANTFAGGVRSTKGAFIEVGVPITSAKQNIIGFHAVDLNLADRYEKIQPGGNANTPKFGLRWFPIDDSFLIRATYAKGFIAPSIFSLFGPAGGNSPSYTILEGNGSSSSGGSLGNKVTGQFGSAVELSNPALPASKSTSYNVGIVFSPRQLKGFTFSADYYRIEQNQVGSIDYTSVYADLNSKGADSVFAKNLLGLGTGFVFADGTKLVTNAPNQVNSTNVGTLSIANYPAGDQWTDGLDLAFDYTFNTDNLGRFGVGAQANILFNYKFRATPDAPYYQYARNFTDSANGLGGQNGLLPSYLVKPYINHVFGPVATSVFLTYLPPVTASGSLFGKQATTNTNTVNGKEQIIPSYFTADVAVNYTLPNFGKSWARNFTLTVGVNNVFNKQPPYVAANGNGAGENNTVKAAYDIIGRFLFVELRKGF